MWSVCPAKSTTAGMATRSAASYEGGWDLRRVTVHLAREGQLIVARPSPGLWFSRS